MAPAEPGEPGLARGHGAPARRSARHHPLLTLHTLPIPTPFAVGRVNAYVVQDDPLTLVDCGPNSGKALDEVERGLNALGHRVEDLGLIVLTHQHMDHTGLASILQRRSGAEVAGLEALGAFLSSYGERMESDDRFAEGLMRRNGVPGQVATALRAVSAAVRGWGARAEITMPLRDGDELALRDRTFRVHHRPGHSPTDTVFHDVAHREMLGGDHLIAHISSNPLITAPVDGSDERPKALLSYLESLRATQAMSDVDVIHAGHGEPVHDHVALIDQRVRMHDRRAAKIHKLIAAEPLTAHEIAQRLWGQVALTQAYLTLSEVLGHIDLLDERGRLDAEDDGEVIRFRAI